ncbi:SMP-30/gluconolactonase/LRE family protein [Flammeovirga agarivorans]|uniref:Major royal jelly protein n=1 Tax=Flammeovirga agarivorans TaxID=2726742 RepID=A0A7X8SQ70_9BACT|nr:L-dopachrome tautomerase-related protein [Flammeovirga agarivorans]NLR94268.1 hypothetical protein [Flammeovirga agarivorans]
MFILRLYTISLLTLLYSCSSPQNEKKSNETETSKSLELVSTSSAQWTGVAVSKKNRVFVNYPKWSENVPVAVAEIINGKPVPYPSEMWNTAGGVTSFTAVQSVVCDGRSRLWVLDTNNPQFRGVLEGGPVLYEFDLNTNELLRSYSFPKETYFEDSYFNDVRIDITKEVAYITDSGHGGIITLNLITGEAKLFFENNKAVKYETKHLICDGIKWENKVNSDGIALSPDNQFLYFIALTGHTLYRINTNYLWDEKLTKTEVEKHIEKVAKIPATDGMLFDRNGNLWLGGLESNSINVFTAKGELKTVLKGSEIRWADSFAKNLDREIYFTTSQIHLPEDKRGQYGLYKISMDLLK